MQKLKSNLITKKNIQKIIRQILYFNIAIYISLLTNKRWKRKYIKVSTRALLELYDSHVYKAISLKLHATE